MPRLIFASRWLQLPLYPGLIVAQVVCAVLFLKERLHLVEKTLSISAQQIMPIMLGLIDVAMISNLLIMVIVGGSETFVSRIELNRHPDQPERIRHVNASVLKIKLAMADRRHLVDPPAAHLCRPRHAERGLHRDRPHVAGDHPRPVVRSSGGVPERIRTSDLRFRKTMAH